MKEPYGEGVANHTGPESCADGRKALGEALTGVHADQPLSSEINAFGVPTTLTGSEGNIWHDDTREPCPGPAESKTLCMRGNSLRGIREISSAPKAEWSDGPVGESPQAYTSDMYAAERSDGSIVPEKPPNKDGHVASAEAVEESGPTKGNASPTAEARTQSRSILLIGRWGVRRNGGWVNWIFMALALSPRYYPG